MKFQRTIEWKRNGKNTKVEITKTREICDKTTNLDGDIINLGREIYEALEIVLRADGKLMTRASSPPHIVDSYFSPDYKNIIAKGGHARLGNIFIGEEAYQSIMIAIAEIEAEASATIDEEYLTLKAAEAAKEAAKDAAFQAKSERYAQNIKNGMCPRCQTWCYGDCRS